MKIPHLITDEERAAFVKKAHCLRVRRVIIAAVFIVIGSLLPEFHPHIISVIVTDGLKGTGYIPLLKLMEDFFV